MIFEGQLNDSGHSVSFKSGEWKVTKGVMMIAWGKKISTFYMTIDPSNVVVVATANDDISLWHNRFGHMSQNEMNELFSKGKLLELKNIHFDMCKSCVMGKQKKNLIFYQVVGH